MRRKVLGLGTVVLLVAAYLLLPGQPVPTEAIDGAEVHLPFDGDLNGRGRVRVQAASDGDAASFVQGVFGQALWSDGSGTAIVTDLPAALRVFDRTEVSLSVKAEDWVNPYGAGSAVQTIAVLTGASDAGLQHLTFSIVGASHDMFEVRFKDTAGETIKMRTGRGAVGDDWQRLSLEVNQPGRATDLLLDGKVVASSGSVPDLMRHRLTTLKFGTWHQQNQAFRGAIDQFVIRDAAVE